jgi:hypothetical protein
VAWGPVVAGRPRGIMAAGLWVYVDSEPSTAPRASEADINLRSVADHIDGIGIVEIKGGIACTPRTWLL